MGQFSVSTSANKPPAISISEISTPNGLLQTTDKLKWLIGYTKGLD